MIFYKFNSKEEKRFITNEEKEVVTKKLLSKNIKFENINFFKKMIMKDRVFLIEVKEEIKSLKILFIQELLKESTRRKEVSIKETINELLKKETFKNENTLKDLNEKEIEICFDIDLKRFKYSKKRNLFFYETDTEIFTCTKDLKICTLNKNSKFKITRKIIKSF